MPLSTETRVEYLGIAIWLMGNNIVVVADVSRPCSQPKGLWSCHQLRHSGILIIQITLTIEMSISISCVI